MNDIPQTVEMTDPCKHLFRFADGIDDAEAET
jgi:hypothetical protein